MTVCKGTRHFKYLGSSKAGEAVARATEELEDVFPPVRKLSTEQN